jgi:hypothetical protein
MARYKGDPRWLEAKYAGKCTGNHGQRTQAIKRGDRVFYYPSSRTILAQPCGHADDASADFNSHTFDESNY